MYMKKKIDQIHDRLRPVVMNLFFFPFSFSASMTKENVRQTIHDKIIACQMKISSICFMILTPNKECEQFTEQLYELPKR